MNTQKTSKAKSKDRLNGKRIFIYKAPSKRHLPSAPGKAPNPYTTLGVTNVPYDEMLRLAHLDEQALHNCARMVSWHAREEAGKSWSATVREGMYRRLRGEHKPARLQEAQAAQAADAELAAQAAANNAAWADTAGAVLLLAAGAINEAKEGVEA